MNIDCMIIKHNLAWIQTPPSPCNSSKKHFDKEVLKFWSNYLHIYTASAYKENENVSDKSKCVLSLFIPQKFKLERIHEIKYDVNNEVTAEVAAIRVALNWILQSITEDMTKLVFFSNCGPVLEYIRNILENDTADESGKEIRHYLQEFKNLGKLIGFAWVPQDVSAYKCVSEYANYWFHDSVLHREKVLPVFSPPNEYYSLPYGCSIYYSKQEAFPHWNPRLLVFTTAVQTDQQNNSNNIGIITSLYIPNPRRCIQEYKLDTPCIWARKSHVIPISNFISTQFEAFHFAVKYISEMNLTERNIFIVFISDSPLNQFTETIKHDMIRRKELVRNVAALKIKGIRIGFTWADRHTYKNQSLDLLQEYTEAWANTDHTKLEYYGNFTLLKRELENHIITSDNSLLSVYITNSKFWIVSGKEISTPHYFYNKILPLWTDNLCVFTKIINEGKTGRYFTYVYIPELNIVEKKINWLTLRNKRNAHFAAIQFAVRIIRKLDIKNRIILIITECTAALQHVTHALRHHSQLKYRRLLINDIEYIRDNALYLTIMSYPQLSNISLWNSIIEYFDNNYCTVTDFHHDCSIELQNIDSENKIIWIQESSDHQDDNENQQNPLSNTLQVFISFVRQVNIDDENDKIESVLSLYFPQLYTWERKLVKSSDGVRSAIDFAVERLNQVQFKESNIIIFTSYDASLEEDIHKINHSDIPLNCIYVMQEISHLKEKGKRVGFILLRENTNIPQCQSAKEFAEAWEYDDHDNVYGFFNEKYFPKDENVVYSWSPACNNYIGRATVNKFHDAWIQLPPKLSVINRKDYFNEEVLNYWSDYVHVYTSAILVHESNGNFKISIYIPGFNVIDRKSIYVSKCDDVSAQLSVLNFALQKCRDLSSIKTKFVFFTKCARTLNSILYVMTHENISECGKILKDNVMYLRKKHCFVAFAWIPPDLKISEYKTVTEYATAQTEEEENETSAITDEVEDGCFDYFDYDVDLTQLDKKQRFKYVFSNVV